MSRKLNPMEEMELRNQFQKGAYMFALQVPEIGIFSFLFGMSELSEKKHQQAVKKNLTNFSKYFFVSSIGGVLFNRGFTKSKFLPNSFYLRFPLRLFLFFLPNLLFSNIYMNSFQETTNIISLYNMRLDKFKKTQDIKYYDPDDAIFQEFVKNLTEFNPGM